MKVSEEAQAEIESEKHAHRVAEAKFILTQVKKLDKERSQLYSRLVELDNGAEPCDYNPFTGDRYLRTDR